MATEVFGHVVVKGSLQVGKDGHTLKGFRVGSVPLPAMTVDGGSRITCEVSLPGAEPGDVIVLTPPDLPALLFATGEKVKDPNRVHFWIVNMGKDVVDLDQTEWDVLWFDLT